MRKFIFTFLVCFFIVASYAQAPKFISYQGVARNSTGAILPSQNIGIKLDLHQGSSGGTVTFSETHNVTTNNFGLFTLSIGSSNTTGFASINWANGPYFLEVSIDPAGGTSYTSIGTQQFMSVPYALYAETSGNASSNPTITINAPNSVTSAGGSYTINIPASATYTAGNGIDITSGVITSTANITGAGSTTVTGTYPNLTISTPTVQSYSGGNGISISSAGVIDNTQPAVTPTITSGNNITVNPTSPSNSYTISAPTYSLSQSGNNINLLQNGVSVGTATITSGTVYTAGNGIDITGGVISNTMTSSTPTIVGTGAATVTSAGNSYTVNTPAQTVYTAGNGIDITAGVITNTLTPATPTLSVSGNSISINPGNTQTLPTYSLSQSGGNIDLLQNGTSIATVSVSTSSTSLTAGNPNILLNQSGNNYTITPVTPVLSVVGGTISGAYPNQTITIPTSSTTVLTGSTNITVSGSAPNYTLSSPSQTLSVSGNSLAISGGNSVTIPTTTINGTGTGIATVTASANNFTVNVPTPSYTTTSGNLAFGTTTVNITPILSLTGTTLTSGPATNSVNLSSLNGIYGGSGALQTGNTTVSIGTNTLTFLSGNTAGKPIANFYGGGITGTSMNIGHIGTNPATLQFLGSATTTPVNYGYVSGSATGLSMSGGSSSNGLYVTNSAEVGVGTYTTGTGKFVIAHDATQSNPTIHLMGASTALNRIKFSNAPVSGKFFETAAQTAAVDANAAYSINYYDGTKYSSVLLVTGERKVSINNLNTVLSSLHVMENSTTAGNGIISEGFAQPGIINVSRNNQPALAARTAVNANDMLGMINFSGFDGSGFGDGATIGAVATENVTSTSKGTDLVFYTVSGGTSLNTEKFRIANNGDVIVNPNNVANNSLFYAKTKVKIDSTLTMGAYPSAPAISLLNEGRIYFDKPSNKFKVSENGSAYVDLISSGPGLWSGAGSNVFLTNSSNFVGIGTNIPESPLHITNSAGQQFKIGNTNQSTYEWIWNVDGTSNLSLINEGNGSPTTRMYFDVNTSKVGFGTTTPNAMLHVLNPSSTFDGLMVGNSTSGNGVKVVQTGSGAGILSQISSSTNSNNAIVAMSNGTGATLYSGNSSTGVAASFSATSAQAIYAQNNSNSATAEMFNNGTGPVISAYKSSGATGGIVANFANNSNANSADVVFAYSNGAGAAVHAANNVSNNGSSVSLWLENGHVKTSGATPAFTSTVTILGSFILIGNDVSGKISITTGLTAVGANQEMIQVTFSKPYSSGSTPNIIISPTNKFAAGVQAYVANVSNTGFSIYFNQSTSASTSYTFNYMVFE